MIIVSQDKEVIVNFNNVQAINVHMQNKKQVAAWFSCNENNRNNVLLGEYATEERAKEVLQEIIRAYVTDRKANDTDNFFGFSMMQKDIYFQMPKE